MCDFLVDYDVMGKCVVLNKCLLDYYVLMNL